MKFEAADLRPGEIVIARVRNPLEDPTAIGKCRPAVLISRDRSTWTAMGLTTQPCFKTTGAPRVPIRNWRDVGLTGPGYLWGRPVRICSLDVERHVGWVDANLAASIIVTAGLDVTDAATLIAAGWRTKAA